MMKTINFGILTLATPNDYLKAIGFALSVRVSNPGIPIAVACSKKVADLVRPYFDTVIQEQDGLRGFVHKVYLDVYSPYQETMFFDSDVLVFKPVLPYIKTWGDGPYHACGEIVTEGYSTFGLDRKKVLHQIGKDKFSVIEGAGHSFFRKPECSTLFDLSRTVTVDYKKYGGGIPYSDEDVVAIAMTMLNIPPVDPGDFFARYSSAAPGTMVMDASKGICSYLEVSNRKPMNPCMVHFAANEAPIQYAQQLFRLFNKFNVPTKGLARQATHDFYELEVKMPISNWLKKFRADPSVRKLQVESSE
jgi:hypothetical protein